jgi:hypothetical protein
MAMKSEGTAVSDRMRYGVKPTAVRSENILSSIKASNGNAFDGNGTSKIIFDIPAQAGGFYLDAAATRFSFDLKMSNIGGGVVTDVADIVYFDKGPNSIIQRLEIFDTAGHKLEDLENYNLTYKLIEVCTSDPVTQACRGSFLKESQPAMSAKAGENAAVPFTCKETRGGYVYAVTGTVLTGAGAYTNNVHTNQHFSLCFHSAVFGGGCERYYPMSAMNGFRMYITLAPAWAAFNDLTGQAGTNGIVYSISDPTLYTNMIRVDPQVDRGIIDSAKGPDGKIRINTQTWNTYQYTIAAADYFSNPVIPVAVSSLKSLFFTFSSVIPMLGHPFTGFFTRYLESYQLFVGTLPIPSSPVLVTAPYAEAMSETMRAWHVRPNDQYWPSLMQETNVHPLPTDDITDSAMVFGVELESFSNRGNTIESGANVLNNTVQLRLKFSNTTTGPMTLTVYCLYDIFLVIDPETGITTVEF